MTFVILKAVGYIFLIFMGYYLKSIGKFQLQDKNVLGTILMYITLPCAFVANFRNFQSNSSLFFFFVFGVFVNILFMYTGKLLSLRQSGECRAEYMIQGSGHNVGAFTTPFVGSIMDPYSTVVTSIFDIGNGIMSVGMIYPLAKREVTDQKGNFYDQLKFVVKKLFSSVPFDTYLVMLVISLMGIRLPEEISDLAQILGAPSIILTMIMIGISLELHVSKEDLIHIIKILLMRYVLALVLVVILLHLPFLNNIEQVALCYCICAPPTSISPTYANLCNCKSEIYGAVSSLSIAISLILFILLTTVIAV